MRILTHLAADEKLLALRAADANHAWESLDDRCTCILCERTFSGRQVEVAIAAHGHPPLACPTMGCASSPNEWVYPGNPLISRKAWHDWERVLGDIKPPRNSPVCSIL